tara:strand:+ start:158 stop:265 length:108 start_codon:yes stop_codon:yes gene_type:complete
MIFSKFSPFITKLSLSRRVRSPYKYNFKEKNRQNE